MPKRIDEIGKDFSLYLQDLEDKYLAPYALRSRERSAIPGFREYKCAPLEFRTDYHRDRDRRDDKR